MKTEKDLHRLNTYKGISNGSVLTEDQKRQLKCINLEYLRNVDLPCTVDWYPSDTKEQFEKLSKEHRGYWDQQDPIKYSLNSFGHRCSEIVEDTNSIMFLGCSMTFGVGMHKEKTWPALVAKSLGKTEYNLGVPAGSLDSAYRLYKEWQPVAKSSLTVIAVPPHYRCEKIIVNEVETTFNNIGQWTIAKDLNEGHQERATRHLSEELNDPNMYISFNKNVEAIQKIADDTGSKLILIDYIKLKNIRLVSRGRDGIHPGEDWHATVAKNVIEMVQN